MELERNLDIHNDEDIAYAAARLLVHSIEFLYPKAHVALEDADQAESSEALSTVLGYAMLSDELPFETLEKIGSFDLLRNIETQMQFISHAYDLQNRTEQLVLEIAQTSDYRRLASVLLLLCPMYDQFGPTIPIHASQRGLARYYAEKSLFKYLLHNSVTQNQLKFIFQACESSMLILPNQIREFMHAIHYYSEIT